MSQPPADRSEVVYFLGNVTSHVVHALPLWREIGGEFVVLSHEACRRLETYNVPVRALDDLPRRWQRTGPRLRRTDQYLHVPGSAARTLRFLEDNARVVVFYELFDFGRRRPRVSHTVHLGHGNWIKPYFSGRNRVELLGRHDHVVAPGPFGRSVMEAMGIESRQLRELGVARSDEVVARKGPRKLTPELLRVIGEPAGAHIFTYVPTYWGPSSAESVGLELVRSVRDDQIMLVRLHPQTPGRLVAAYREAARSRPHVHLLLGDAPGLGLIDLMAAADAVIGDVSSVMLEALLLDKPLVFAGGDDALEILHGHPITQVVERSTVLRPGASAVDLALDSALTAGIDSLLWAETKRRLFYHADGTSVRHLADFIGSL